jgi:MFS transporter, PPP family, 3-phenylpropionic acid transporter
MVNRVQTIAAWPSLTWRLGFLYAALFLVVGCYLPYLPVWLKWRALDADQIAVLLATPLYVRILFTPAISFAADRLGGRRIMLIALAWGSLVSFALLWLSDGFWQMLLTIILLAINWTTIMPLVETIAIGGIRKSGLDYGRVRLWGSLSFIGASLGAGLVIQLWGPGAVLPMLLVAAALMVLGAYLVPQGMEPRVTRTESAAPHLNFRDAFALLRAPLFLIFLLAASMIQASHALLYAFGSLHWRAQGFSGGTIGVLWSVGVIAEVALFAVSGRVIAWCGATRLLAVAGGAAVLRWSFMAIDPSLWATGVLQLLHAMTFGATHLAAIHFLTHAMPEDRAATAQGLYAAVVAGLVMGSVTIACGPLYRMFGGEAYAAMAVIALIGTGAAVLLRRRWHGGLVVGAVAHPLETSHVAEQPTTARD